MSARGHSLRKGYESIPREVLQPQDGRMSARALGVLAHLLSRPDGWQSSAERLARTFKEGRVAMERALNELEDLGYLARRRVRVQGGQFGWLWLYGDDPAYVAEHLAERITQVTGMSRPSAVPQEPAYGEGQPSTFAPDPSYPSTDEPSLDSWCS